MSEVEAVQKDKQGPKRSALVSFLIELPVLIISAIALAWVIKSFVVQPFYIPSASMEPTLYKDDRVLVSKLSYRLRSPSPGEIVVFVETKNEKGETDYIKRVIATAGMHVEETDGKMLINGKAKKEPYVRPDNPSASFGPTTVPAGKIFVMGDNRAYSRDSRYIGPIKKKDVIGKAFLIYWPPNRIRWLR